MTLLLFVPTIVQSLSLYLLFVIPAVIILTAVIILDITLLERSPLARLLSWPPLVYTGVISYGIYLWHFPLLYFIRSTPLDTAVARAALAFGLTPIIATISYWQFERKITQLKHRLPAAPLSFSRSRLGGDLLRSEVPNLTGVGPAGSIREPIKAALGSTNGGEQR